MATRCTETLRTVLANALEVSDLIMVTKGSCRE